MTGDSKPDQAEEPTLKRITTPVLLTSLLAGLLLSACAATTYVPRIRDVTEEPIMDDYWYQRFTLYTPGSSATDCQISRTGRRINLNSPAELADAWRQFCRSGTDHDSGGSSN
jgi:hypothetical protein